MSDTGYQYPGSSAVSTSIHNGHHGWNDTNCRTNNAYSTKARSVAGEGTDTDAIKVYNFGLSADIPAGSTIDGVVSRLEHKLMSISSGTQNAWYITKNGTSTSGNNKGPQGITTSTSTKTVGSSSDLWGTTLSYAEITATNFGFACWYTHGASKQSNAVWIDSIECTIYYTEPPPADVFLVQFFQWVVIPVLVPLLTHFHTYRLKVKRTWTSLTSSLAAMRKRWATRRQRYTSAHAPLTVCPASMRN